MWSIVIFRTKEALQALVVHTQEALTTRPFTDG